MGYGGSGYGYTGAGYGYGVSDFVSVYDALPTSELLTSVGRRLTARYTGPVCRLRRSSDNVERDFFGSGVLGLVDANAVADFCGAGSGFLVTQYDQSGNARHFSQATTTLQPIVCESGVPVTEGGRLSAKYVAAEARRMAIPSSTAMFNYLHTTGGTVALVAKANDTAATKAIVGSQTSSTESGIRLFFSSDEALSTVAGNGTNQIISGANTATQSLANKVIVLEIDPDNTTAANRALHYVDGVSANTSNNNITITPVVQSASASMTLGARGSANDPHDGTISEVAIWSTFLSEAQRKALEADQGRFYGITVAP